MTLTRSASPRSKKAGASRAASKSLRAARRPGDLMVHLGRAGEGAVQRGHAARSLVLVADGAVDLAAVHLEQTDRARWRKDRERRAIAAPSATSPPASTFSIVPSEISGEVTRKSARSSPRWRDDELLELGRQVGRATEARPQPWPAHASGGGGREQPIGENGELFHFGTGWACRARHRHHTPRRAACSVRSIPPVSMRSWNVS